MSPSPKALAPGACICDSVALEDGGSGVRFELDQHGYSVSAFVVRHAGNVYAYLNRCAHKFVELDWEPGEFFDAERRYLLCATHGALYEPATGCCVAGPCHGARLVPVAVREADGGVWLAGTAADVLK